MITLFQHQQQALDETEGKNRVAYYLDMGLGKTFVGSEKMMKLDKRINLVVCQCSKVQDWIEHFQDHYTRNCVFDLTNPKTFKWFFEQVQHEVPTLMIGVTAIRISLKSMKSTGIRMTNTGCTNIWLKPMASIFPMNGKILMSSLLSRLLSSATSADGTAE